MVLSMPRPKASLLANYLHALTLVWMSRTIFISKSSRPLSSIHFYQLQAAEPLPAAVIKQIAKELKDLQEKPEEGIKVCLLTPLAGNSCCCFIMLTCFSAAAVFE